MIPYVIAGVATYVFSMILAHYRGYVIGLRHGRADGFEECHTVYKEIYDFSIDVRRAEEIGRLAGEVREHEEGARVESPMLLAKAS